MFEGRQLVTGQALVSQALAAEQIEDDALELAVREHARLVYRVAYSVLRNHHDAEDATQETFLRVLRYRRKLAGIRDSRTWLARIAWRVALERRRRAPEVLLEEASMASRIPSAAASADQALLGQEMSALFEGLIAALPAKLRDPLILSALEEMSITDIAEVLGINAAAARSRLFRARQILREKFAALPGTL
jgi:RNA polymerase sigma-70 factor (ECF subfamily)